MNAIHKAAENLPGHWYQGDYSDQSGNYCGLGHVMKANGMQGTDIDLEEYPEDEHGEKIKEQINLLNQVAYELFPDRAKPFGDEIDATKFGYSGCFPAFNDHPETTEDEVVAVLEKGAIRWDERV